MMIIDDGMMWHLMRGAWLCLQPMRACVSQDSFRATRCSAATLTHDRIIMYFFT